MIVAGTGHRPDKIGGYEWEAPKRVWIRQQIKQALIDLHADAVVSGFALGFDQDLAFVSFTMGIPYTAALAVLNQDAMWPPHARKWFDYLLERANNVKIVSLGEYAAYKMQVRNKWMVDNSDILLACWDGSDGGTGNCIKYAQDQNAFIHYINPNDFHQDGP